MKNRPIVILKGILVSLLFAIVSVGGICTILVLESSKPDPDILSLWQNIILSILCSVIASIIFAILMRIYSRNDSGIISKQLENIDSHLARQNELYDSGIKSIRPKAHFDQEDDYWNGIINGSIRRLDLTGHSLHNWFGRRYRGTFITKVSQIINSGGIVNIVLSTSASNNIEEMLSRAKSACWKKEIVLNKVEQTLFEFYQILKQEDIPEKNRCNLRIYVTDVEQVTYFYIRTDTQCIISPYTYSPGTRENIFLLELRPDTDHVKILEDDFDEMIGNMIPLDFRIQDDELHESGMKTDRLNNKIQDDNLCESSVQLECCYSGENNYKSKEWNQEKTNKFVFRDNHGIYEAGLFRHYMDKTFIKTVIELPVGFGCPSKCHYCASARINGFYAMDVQQMKSIFEQLYWKNNLDTNSHVLLSMTGMGDVFFNQKNVFAFLDTLRGYKNLSVTLSSNFWTAPLLAKAIAVNDFLPIRYIQYTYVSYKKDVCERLIDILSSMEETDFFDNFISFIKEDNNVFYRINYIVIGDINDSMDDVDRFICLIDGIKHKVTIRISRLNETGATRENHLRPPDCARLGEINERMKNAGLHSYIFYSESNDNMNCGQLITESMQL